MKHSNNTIKFLLAQYRAIYKHAYIKGVLSAAVLSLGLVSSAQARTGYNFLDDSADFNDTPISHKFDKKDQPDLKSKLAKANKNSIPANYSDYLMGELNKSDSEYYDFYNDNGLPTPSESDLYLGKDSVFFFNENLLSDNNDTRTSALHFNKKDATIKAEPGAKIILADATVDKDNNVTLFRDNGSGSKAGVRILDNDIRVETLNGLMYFILAKNTEVTGGRLITEPSKIQSSFAKATSPSRDTLFKILFGVHNYQEAGDMHTGLLLPNVKKDYLHGSEAPKGVNVNEKGHIVIDRSLQNQYKTDQFVVVESRAFFKVQNEFLERAKRDTDGTVVDQVGRISAFGGAAESALLISQTNTDAIATRMGVGAYHPTFSFANNGQGVGIWLSPIYKHHSSDGFAAHDLNYGVDIDLYGLALGSDYTLSNGLTLGVMLNVGSGEADGQGLAKGIDNDLNYYGLGMYISYPIDKFSIYGDISYSVIDNEMTAKTSIDTVKANMHSNALSLGITTQYDLSFNNVDIKPHAGLRFTHIDIEDYDIHGNKYTNIGSFEGSDANIFSIPVGVSISKKIETSNWTIRPSFDLTLMSNFGDDSLEGNMKWAEYANLSTSYSSEFVDSFTYSTTLGISAQNGNFIISLGANYVGSSNTDEYGINANARFVF